MGSYADPNMIIATVIIYGNYLAYSYSPDALLLSFNDSWHVQIQDKSGQSMTAILPPLTWKIIQVLSVAFSNALQLQFTVHAKLPANSLSLY